MAPAAAHADPYLRERLSEIAAPTARDTVALVGEVVLAKFTNGTPRLQPRAPMSQQSESNVRSHRAASNRPHNGERIAAVSPQIDCKTISERAKAALERRLRPNTTLSAYELAYTLRVSEGTIWNILRGSKSGPSGRVLFKLTEFFGGAFLNEVFGGPNVYCIDPRETRKLAHVQRIRELQAELEAMG